LLCLLVFASGFLSHFRAVISVIVIAFLSSEHYFITGFYSYFYSYGLLLKLNDDDDDDDLFYICVKNMHILSILSVEQLRNQSLMIGR